VNSQTATYEQTTTAGRSNNKRAARAEHNGNGGGEEGNTYLSTKRMVFDGLQKGELSTVKTMAEMMTSPIWAPMGWYWMAVGPRAAATAAGSAEHRKEEMQTKLVCTQ